MYFREFQPIKKIPPEITMLITSAIEWKSKSYVPSKVVRNNPIPKTAYSIKSRKGIDSFESEF